MANYTSTVILNALAQLSDTANKDLRAPIYGALMAFNDYKRDVIMNYDEFKNVKVQSELQTKQVDYLIRSSESVGSARSASLTGAHGDSVRDTLTFVTYTREFTISDDMARNNVFKASNIMAAQIRNSILDIYAEIESDAVAKLEAFKDTTTKSTNLGTWDSTNYVLEVANANKTEYFNYIQADMEDKTFYGRYQSINTPSTNVLARYQQAQGAGNSTNLAFQYPNFDMYTSSSVSNLSDYLNTNYVVPIRTIGLIDWIPGKNREGMVNHGLWSFTSMPDPTGLFDALALAQYNTVVDNSSGGNNTGGSSQDASWLYELSVDVAFYIPTLSTYKLVQKYGLLKS